MQSVLKLADIIRALIAGGTNFFPNGGAVQNVVQYQERFAKRSRPWEFDKYALAYNYFSIKHK